MRTLDGLRFAHVLSRTLTFMNIRFLFLDKEAEAKHENCELSFCISDISDLGIRFEESWRDIGTFDVRI